MQNKEKYFIIDENAKYVVGYVMDGNDVKYIAYDTNESFAIRPFNSKTTVEAYIKHLSRISYNIGDNHIFKYYIQNIKEK